VKSRAGFPVRIKPVFKKPGFGGTYYKGIASKRLLMLRIMRRMLGLPSLVQPEKPAGNSDDIV
jgi:hypothetical protein